MPLLKEEWDGFEPGRHARGGEGCAWLRWKAADRPIIVKDNDVEYTAASARSETPMDKDSFLAAHRLMMWALIAAFAVFCLWAAIGRVDIVVTAQGKLTPTASVPVAQPVVGGVVRRILVNDGESVASGQSLIELDAVSEHEAQAAAAAEVRSLNLQLKRLDAELQGREPDIEDASVLAEFRSRRAAQEALLKEALRQRDSADAELATAEQRQAKAQALAPVAARQAAMLETLLASRFVSEAAHNEKLLARIETTRELAVQERAVATAAALRKQADAGVEKVRAAYRQQLSIERNDVVLRLAKGEAALAQATHRSGLQVLRAPVAGRVTGLRVFSPGRVVAAGETLVSVVPAADPLRFEGWLRNEDTSFIVPGMPVRVKLAAYPFQKYGWLEGELTWLGVDAEVPESMRNSQGEPLFYRARISLSKQSLGPEQQIALRAGLQGAGDIQVGTRTLFEYLTSPLRKVVLEAARER